MRNPRNPHVNQTHAGVLEFIADDPGIVYLPAWVSYLSERLSADSQMMQTLQLNEGDPVRLTGTELPKGKFVKLQAQSVDFLQVSDPKAVYVNSEERPLTVQARVRPPPVLHSH